MGRAWRRRDGGWCAAQSVCWGGRGWGGVGRMGGGAGVGCGGLWWRRGGGRAKRTGEEWEGQRRQRGPREAERQRERQRGAVGGSWRQRENREAERRRWSARVATHVVGDEHAVEPHGGVAEGALEVEPEHVALPLRGDGELLPVPKHVAGEVRLARAAIGAGALRGRARDQAVVWQADLRPVVVSVLRHGLVRSGTGVRVGWRLCVPVGFRVQASAVSPPKVEA